MPRKTIAMLSIELLAVEERISDILNGYDIRLNEIDAALVDLNRKATASYNAYAYLKRTLKIQGPEKSAVEISKDFNLADIDSI